VNGLQQFGVGWLPFPLQIGHLPADHAADGAGSGREFADQLRAPIAVVSSWASTWKAGEERIAGQNRHGVAEDFVGW